MKKFVLLLLAAFIMFGCASNSEKGKPPKFKAPKIAKTEEPEPVYDKVDGVAVDMNNKGIGPVKSVTIPETIDMALAKEGEETYNALCLACHRPTQKFIGPAPKGVLERRAPEWVMNMIINPEKMVAEDPIAKKLLIEYNGSPMANQGVTVEKARAIVEYFRTL
ncbi:MAG: cytochrome c [Bacteroidales bacterium]